MEAMGHLVPALVAHCALQRTSRLLLHLGCGLRSTRHVPTASGELQRARTCSVTPPSSSRGFATSHTCSIACSPGASSPAQRGAGSSASPWTCVRGLCRVAACRRWLRQTGHAAPHVKHSWSVRPPQLASPGGGARSGCCSRPSLRIVCAADAAFEATTFPTSPWSATAIMIAHKMGIPSASCPSEAQTQADAI